MYIPRKEEKKDKEGELQSKLDSHEGLNSAGEVWSEEERVWWRKGVKE